MQNNNLGLDSRIGWKYDFSEFNSVELLTIGNTASFGSSDSSLKWILNQKINSRDTVTQILFEHDYYLPQISSIESNQTNKFAVAMFLFRTHKNLKNFQWSTDTDREQEKWQFRLEIFLWIQYIINHRNHLRCKWIYYGVKKTKTTWF